MTLGNVTSDSPITSDYMTGAGVGATANSVLTEAYRMVKQFDQQATSPEYSVTRHCQ
jgi:hypothetical protein